MSRRILAAVLIASLLAMLAALTLRHSTSTARAGAVINPNDFATKITNPWLPYKAGKAVVLDLVRQRRNAPPGTVEQLLARALDMLRDMGFEEASLTDSVLDRSEIDTVGVVAVGAQSTSFPYYLDSRDRTLALEDSPRAGR